MTEIPPAEAERRPTKQVIVIRRDLRMRRGKEIAQGAHAATAWLADRVLQTIGPNGDVDHVALSPAERAWLESSFRKVTVKVNSEEELVAVYQKALDAGLVVHLITDRGLTEFGGVAHPDLPGRRPRLRRPHRPDHRRPRTLLTASALTTGAAYRGRHWTAGATDHGRH